MASGDKDWIDDFKLLLLVTLGITLASTFAAIGYQNPTLMGGAAGAALYSAFLQLTSRRKPRDLPNPSTHELPDEDDIKRMTELIDQNYRLVLGLSYRMVGNPNDAVIIAERTFKDAWRELIMQRKREAYADEASGYSSDSLTRAYLMSHASRMAIDLLRSRSAQQSRLREAERTKWEEDRIEVPGVEVEDAQRELAEKLLKQSA